MSPYACGATKKSTLALTTGMIIHITLPEFLAKIGDLADYDGADWTGDPHLIKLWHEGVTDTFPEQRASRELVEYIAAREGADLGITLACPF